MLLPSTDQRVYGLGDKQLIKIFADILLEDAADLEEQLLQSVSDFLWNYIIEKSMQGEISDTIANAFEKSTTVHSATYGTLDLQGADIFLDELSKSQHDTSAQERLFRKIIKRWVYNIFRSLMQT